MGQYQHEALEILILMQFLAIAMNDGCMNAGATRCIARDKRPLACAGH
jgi:hypothetical protein